MSVKKEIKPNGNQKEDEKDARFSEGLFDPEKDVERHIEGYPISNELVVATVVDVLSHGCYVVLDEYEGRRAYIHISELSRTWVNNIRVHVREGQRIVGRVIRVEPFKEQIDLSIKRVSEEMRKLKILEAKREQTAKTLFNMIVEQIPEKERDKATDVKTLLIAKFELLYEGLEYAAKNSIKDLIEIGLDETWAKTIHKISSENIIPPSVEIKGTITLSIPTGNGIDNIKEVLLNARDNIEEKNAKIKIYTEGSPHYAIEVQAEDYKIAERILEVTLKRMEDLTNKFDGIFSFERK